MASMTRQAGLLSSIDTIRFLFKSVIGIVLARVLSQEDYGSYRQLFLIYATFSTLLLVGIPQSMMFFIPKLGREERSGYITRIVDMVSVLALAFTVLILIFSPVISGVFKNPGLRNLLLVFSIYPLFMFVNQIYSFIMLGMQKPDKVVAFSVISIIADLILIAGLAILTKSLFYIVLGLIISAFIQWVYVRLQLHNYSAKYVWNRQFYKDQLRYSIPLGLSSIIGMLTIQLDKMVISGVFSPAAFAVFSIGAMELPFIGILTNSVNSVILPVLSKSGNTEDAIQIFRGSIRKNALIIFPLAILCFLLASDIISFLYGSSYEESAPYFRIYLFTILLRVGSYGIVFQALNQNRYILINAVITLVSNLILNLILVYTPLGMQGPAIATVLVTYLSAALYLWWMKNKLSMDISRMFPFMQLVRTMTASMIAGLILAIILPSIGTMLLRLILGTSLFGVIYLISAYLTGAILPYDLDTMLSFVREIRGRVFK